MIILHPNKPIAGQNSTRLIVKINITNTCPFGLELGSTVGAVISDMGPPVVLRFRSGSKRYGTCQKFKPDHDLIGVLNVYNDRE